MKRDTEKRVVRAAMHWYRNYGSDIRRWGDMFPFDRQLNRACAAHAKQSSRAKRRRR